MDEWPSTHPEDAIGRDKAIAVAQVTAEEFRNSAPNGKLWETPVKKLATRDWELVAKRTGEETLGRSLESLQATDIEIPVKPLHDVADLFVGVSYGKAVTTTNCNDPSASIGLLRVADVDQTGIRTPSLYLTEEGSARIQPKQRLRVGDVLITTSGTIAKLGLVSITTGNVGVVAAKSIVVIRPEAQVSPQYLKCLLTSGSYQEWLRGHARGATIQHLSVRTLRHLPVPVPEVPIQERVVRRTVEESSDPIVAMVSILTDGGDDPIVTWLTGSSDVQELLGLDQPAIPTALLERISHSVHALQNQVANSHIQTMPDLAKWLIDLAEGVGTLQGLKHVPPGPGRLAILDSAQLRLEQVRSALGESSLPSLDSARDVTKGISRLIRTELGSLLEDVRLEPGVRPDAVVAESENEVQVRLENQSPLALRNILVSTSPNIGSTNKTYLSEGQVLSFAVQIPARTEIGPFHFRLKWRATRLDGRSVSGEVSLAVDVRPVHEAVHQTDLGTSPYIVGGPIDREEMFFGRQDIIDKIQRQLSTSQRANVILLEGNRRTGKTSILKRLQGPDVLPGWIVVNCSFQGGEGHESKSGLPTNEVFRLMARDIGWAFNDAGLRVWFPGMKPPEPGKPFKVAFIKALSAAFTGSSRPFEIFELYLQEVLQVSSPRRLLLMLDEFDKLQEGIDNGITSPQVPENIRYLLHTYPSLSAVLTGSRRLKRLREEYWSALFGFGHRVPVSELPSKDAGLLATRPVEGRLTYVSEATDHLVDLCARQPFLIQSLCNRIFEHAALSNERTVTVGVVDMAAREMVQDNEHFRTLWDYAGTERRRFVLALCQHLEPIPDPVTLSLLETKLEEYGIVLPHGDRLGVDLEYLRELELIELQRTTRGSAYVLTVPLMANWIRLNIDFEDLRQSAVREGERLEFDGYDYVEGDGLELPNGSGDQKGLGHLPPTTEEEK